MGIPRWTGLAAMAGVLALIQPHGANALAAPPPPAPALHYADLVDLADSAPLVIRAEIRNADLLPAARAPDVRPGWGRLYVEAVASGALRGMVPQGMLIRYLADVPLGPKGKPAPYKKQSVLLFARGKAGSDEVQLVAPDAQLIWTQDLDVRVRSLLSELGASDAPPRVNGVTQALFEPGNLVGEGETQLFLSTANSQAATITVLHKPGQPTNWSVSFSEVVDARGRPPVPDTLAWYRLACGLPRTLPSTANVSDNNDNRVQAAVDYENILHDLGPCERARGH